ncbi:MULTISPECIES: hypothetical protein [unclassified Nostoc]|uniref:hypothetical protein n=1 Tax=unclassified Nostoc TaxID=2593658 RepID=UPI002AD2A499|nr:MULTISPECIES: hypothetical protein [unclassified Nostoc]MDZ8124619.1 hypothetical protein [Nostoc sp. CmiVER01]MDZ8223363.1 hypothetical protein [Nostoc sp. ChiVER01]
MSTILATTAVTLTTFKINSALAVELSKNSFQQFNQIATVTGRDDFNDDLKNSQQEKMVELYPKDTYLIAQAFPFTARTFYLTTTTDQNGFFSVAHGLPSTSILGIVVAIQHANGNWHTLEGSSFTNDERFWWNTTTVTGGINSPNFQFRPVKIIIFVYP